MMPQMVLVRVGLRDLLQRWHWRAAWLGILALSVGLISEVRAATTWTVCASGCDYSRIQAAIAAPTTVDGDTLALAAGTYTEAGITVDKSLTLQGAEAATTIVQAAPTRGTATDRVFTIPSGVTVTLQDLTIRYGRKHGDGGGVSNTGTLTLSHSIIQGNNSTGFDSGGGGLSNGGTLTLTHSTVKGNATDTFGGGLFNYGTLTITHSTVKDNAAAWDGGGFSNGGTLTLTHSTVRGNSARDYGGGLVNFDGILSLTDSTVRGNAALYGGGLKNWATGTLIASTISTNAAGDGGGLHNSGTLLLTNSTLSGNTATGAGGGLFNYGTLTLTHSTVSGNATDTFGGGLYNSYGTLILTSSLVAENADGGDCRNLGGPISSQGYNLDSDGSCQLTAPTDRPGTYALLGPLQDHGGPTLTHALLPGSLAMDAIPWGANGCGTIHISDQRGQARPQPVGGACDSGAYEAEVEGQALGGWVTGLTPQTSVCRNVTTGQAVTLSAPVAPWDCEAAGLGVTPGDRVALRVRGPVPQGATDVGGAVVGMAPTSGGCANLTTGQQVTFQHMVGATAASCGAVGLVMQPGDGVQIHVQGTAE